jgi:hypothetical protein
MRKLMVTLDDIEDDPELVERFRKRGKSPSLVERWIPGQWIMTVCGKDLRTSDGSFLERSGPISYLDVKQDNYESNQIKRSNFS